MVLVSKDYHSLIHTLSERVSKIPENKNEAQIDFMFYDKDYKYKTVFLVVRRIEKEATTDYFRIGDFIVFHLEITSYYEQPMEGNFNVCDSSNSNVACISCNILLYSRRII